MLKLQTVVILFSSKYLLTADSELEAMTSIFKL